MSSPLFWVAVSFVIFMALVAKPACKILAKMLDQRSAKIRQELEDATRLKEEAQNLLAQIEQQHRKLSEESKNILSHAQAESAHIRKEAEARLEYDLNKRTELAMQKIAQAEAAVVSEIQRNAVDITLAAARTLIVENLGKEVAEEIIAKAISDINRKLH